MTAGCAASRRVLARTPVAPLPASSPKRPTGINGRTSAPPEMYLPEVCSFQLPKVCSFRLPLTRCSRSRLTGLRGRCDRPGEADQVVVTVLRFRRPRVPPVPRSEAADGGFPSPVVNTSGPEPSPSVRAASRTSMAPSVASGRHPPPRTDRSTAKRTRLRTPPSSHPSASRTPATTRPTPGY